MVVQPPGPGAGSWNAWVGTVAEDPIPAPPARPPPVGPAIWAAPGVPTPVVHGPYARHSGIPQRPAPTTPGGIGRPAVAAVGPGAPPAPPGPAAPAGGPLPAGYWDGAVPQLPPNPPATNVVAVRGPPAGPAPFQPVVPWGNPAARVTFEGEEPFRRTQIAYDGDVAPAGPAPFQGIPAAVRPAQWPGLMVADQGQWPALLNTGFFAESLLLTPERGRYNALAGTYTGPSHVMVDSFTEGVRLCWEMHARAVMESDPMPYYNLRCVLPHVWLYLEEGLRTVYQKSGPLSYTLADNGQLIDSMVAAYTAWYNHAARGDIAVLLGRAAENVREALHLPGYVRGNLVPSRIPVLRAETALGGSVEVFTGLKPTIVLQAGETPR